MPHNFIYNYQFGIKFNFKTKISHSAVPSGSHGLKGQMTEFPHFILSETEHGNEKTPSPYTT